MKLALHSILSAGALGLASLASAQSSLPKDSPFQPASAPAAVAAAPAEPYQLTGVTAAPEGSRVCILDSAARHSRWIAVGATADGIQVVSYDAAQKQAVISVAGVQHTLVLRESATAAEAPVANTPEAKAKEARLLTGDLLEIGRQQRQDYANAHKATGN